MHNIELLEGRKCRVVGQTLEQEFSLAIAHLEHFQVEADALAHGLQRLGHLALERGLVVDHVHAGMADPGLGAALVDLARHLDGLRARGIVIERVELLGTIGRRDQVYDLIVAVVSQVDLVPVRVPHLEYVPLVGRDVSDGVHGASIVNDHAALVVVVEVVLGHIVYRVFYLYQSFQQVLLKVDLTFFFM